MSFREKLWLSLLMIGSSCWACGRPGALVPMTPRPDTRQLGQVNIDSSLVRPMIAQYRDAYPNEIALCLVGALHDTVVSGDRWLVAEVTMTTVAMSDSADAYHVFFPSKPRTGCAGPIIGVSHDHPHITAYLPCEHSLPDAMVLFRETRALFSILFCGDGRTELLLQDGRRIPGRWNVEP